MHHRLFTALAAALITTWVAGCAKKKVWVAKPSSGNGISLTMSSYEYDKDDINLLFSIKNDTSDTMTIDLNSIAVVLPDGQEFNKKGGKSYFTLWGGMSRYHRIRFKVKDYDLRDADGVWLRFDGVFIGDSRLQIPPMALSTPSHSAGTPKELAVPDIAIREFQAGRERTGGNLQVATATVTNNTTAAAPRASSTSTSTSTSNGNRMRIRQENTKVAAMPFKSSNVSETVSFIIDDLLLTELQTVGFQAIGPEDINALLGFDNMKDQLNCDDTSCVTEIGNALGVKYLASGNIALVDGTTVMTLKLINVREASVLARVSKLADGGPKELPKIIADAVQEMVKRSGL